MGLICRVSEWAIRSSFQNRKRVCYWPKSGPHGSVVNAAHFSPMGDGRTIRRSILGPRLNTALPRGHMAHLPITGSEATIRCPHCETTRNAKVVLDTADERFYRCVSCHHTWREPKGLGRPESSKRKNK